MGVDYTKLAATAKRLVEENGRAIKLISDGAAAADPNKPWEGPASTTETTVDLFGVFVPPNTVRQFGLTALGEGTEFRDLVTYSEQIAIVFPGETDLRGFNHMEDNGVRWGIIGLQVLRPGPTQLLAFVGVRR